MLTNHVDVANHLVDNMTFYHVHNSDISVLIGPDSLDLLHSVTTQSVNNLKENSSIFASILNSNGRMIDRILIWNLGDQIAIIHLDGCSDSTRVLLSKSVSWKQDVKIIPLDSGFSSLWVYDSVDSTEPFSVSIDDHVHSCYINNGIFVHLGPNTEINKLQVKMNASGVFLIKNQDLRLFKIMNGQIDGEIVQTYNPIPLEVSLSDDISFTKGCYTEQEIIARMDARGSLSRTLVTFSSNNEITSGNNRIVGGGKLVSYDSVSHDNIWMNLGLIHPDFSDVGTEFVIDDSICRIVTKW